jgi:hypothetical protein
MEERPVALSGDTTIHLVEIDTECIGELGYGCHRCLPQHRPRSGLGWTRGRHEFRGGHERFGRHERFERFGRFHRPFVGFGFSPYPYYAAPYYGYAPPVCSLRPGYFVNQPFVDRWGHYTYRQQWVPSQRVC